jgi:hypothetical protein
VAFGYQPIPWLQPEAELNYARLFTRGAPDSHALAVTAGFVLPPADWITARLGGQQGISGRNADRTTDFRISIDWYF